MVKSKSPPELKITEKAVKAVEKPLPSFEEFRESVKYALTNDHGMPPLYADEILDGERDFLERHRLNYYKDIEDVGAVARAADGLRYEPPKGIKWIALEQGQCVADQDQIVLDVNNVVGKYLESLVALGLHGANKNAVASAMLAKGIETVFPLILASSKR